MFFVYYVKNYFRIECYHENMKKIYLYKEKMYKITVLIIMIKQVAKNLIIIAEAWLRLSDYIYWNLTQHL